MKITQKANTVFTQTENFVIHSALTKPYVDEHGEVDEATTVFTIVATHKDDTRKASYNVYINEYLLNDQYFNVAAFIDNKLSSDYQELVSK